ncbi:FAB1 family protein [Aphelenchoides avenae]|nr:FAB1 family protein [Aphelenchus avenae]
MKSILLASVVLIVFHVHSAQDPLEDFLDRWTLHHSDNFEAYLSERQIPWFMRQLIKLTRLKRTYRKSSSKNGVYECEIDVDDEKTILWTFKLGEEFENEYLEGRNHTIKITYDNDKKVMEESHFYPNNHNETYQLSIVEEGKYLQMAMRSGNVTTRRFYKKDPLGSV